jgi:hypothetical protein
MVPSITHGGAMRTSRILSLSLPPALLREAERLAKQEGGREASSSGRPSGATSRSAAGPSSVPTGPARRGSGVSPRGTSSASSPHTARAGSARGCGHQRLHLRPELRRPRGGSPRPGAPAQGLHVWDRESVREGGSGHKSTESTTSRITLTTSRITRPALHRGT